MAKDKVISLRAAFEAPSPDGEVAVVDGMSSLAEAAYQQIRHALMDGRFAPGQQFTIRALAEVFGTSPMPMRDALKRLVAERALELRPNRSVLLPFMSRARFQEILQIRLALEPMLTLRAATRITARDIEAMAADHEVMCRAVTQGQAVSYLAANRRFHFRLYLAAGTLVMMPMVESLWMQIGPYLHQVFKPHKAATEAADHHHMDVLRALRRHDAEAASHSVWSDLSDAGDEILQGNLFAGEVG
jgi:DNA-binding GntR family transcriptional regulator